MRARRAHGATGPAVSGRVARARGTCILEGRCANGYLCPENAPRCSESGAARTLCGMNTDATFGGADPSTVSFGGTYHPHSYATGYQAPEGDASSDVPEGADTPPVSDAERDAGTAATNLRDRAAYYRDHRSTMTAAQRESVAQHVSVTALRFQRAWGHGLAADGVYGPRTRTALAQALAVSASSLPPTVPRPRTWPDEVATARSSLPTSSPRATTPADTETPPAWLAPAAALAKWSEHARAVDSTAATVLARMRQNASAIAHEIDEGTMAGLEVGSVPPAPTASEMQAWAAALWRRAREAGEAGRAALASESDSLIREAEAALVEVRRRLDRETDTAVREALGITEGALTAILRPLSRGIATAARPLAGPLLLLGLGALALSSRR